MPVILHRQPAVESVQEDVAARLHDANGELTLEGQVVVAFLESVNFNDIIDDADLAEFVESVTVKGTVGEDDEVIEAAKDAKDAEEVVTETMTGEDAAEFVDEEDMLGMFEFFVSQMPATTVEEKVLKAAGERLLGTIEETEEVVEAAKEGDEGAVRLDEAKGLFKKGDFVKIRKGSKKTPNGKSGPELVKRMLIAMMHKGAIKRVGAKSGYTPRGDGKPGKGYSGGDYTKDAGYGEGTPAGRAKVAKYKAGGKSKASSQKAKRTVKGAAAAEMKAKAKEKAAKAKAKAAALAKKKPGAATTKKKSLTASDDTVRSDRIDEGLALAGGIISGMNKSGSGKPTNKPLNG